MDHFNRALELQGEARLVALDILKAFDKVWHKGLLHKLRWHCVSGVMHLIISAFLTNRKMKVVLEGQSSPTCSINSGVPQGSVIGPSLFLVYINYLPDDVLSQLAIQYMLMTPHFTVHLLIHSTPLVMRLEFYGTMI